MTLFVLTNFYFSLTASAGYGVGASAAIGGGLGEEGGAGGVGSEAHAGGVQKKVVRLGQTNNHEVVTNEVVNVQEQVPVVKSKTRSKVKTIVKTEEPSVSEDEHVTYIKKKVVSRPHKVRIVTRTRPVHNEGPQNFDFSKFFDFQYFTNAASGFSNPQPYYPGHTEHQPGKTVTYVENHTLTPIRKVKKVSKVLKELLHELLGQRINY